MFLLISHPYLRNHPGLREKLCCGDITLIFHHTPSLADCDESILEKVDTLNDSAPKVSRQNLLDLQIPPANSLTIVTSYNPYVFSHCRTKAKKKRHWKGEQFCCVKCGVA